MGLEQFLQRCGDIVLGAEHDYLEGLVVEEDFAQANLDRYQSQSNLAALIAAKAAVVREQIARFGVGARSFETPQPKGTNIVPITPKDY